MKSIIVWFMFYMPLDKFASENYLISNILTKGSENYKTHRDILKYLNRNYGAVFGSDTNLKGEIYTLSFYMNYINPNLDYIKDYTSKDMLTFLKSIIYNPLREGNLFNKEYFKIEKKSLLNELARKINNKDSYAFSRTIEIMCENEPYSIDRLGKYEWAKEITNEKCFKRYQTIVNKFPLKIYIMGNIEEKEFTENINEVFDMENDNNFKVEIKNKSVEDPKEVTESIKGVQGKLLIGFRTPVNMLSKEFVALSVFNRLFGGGPESKLFSSVREKENICYTVQSIIEKHKGLIFVFCGLDSKDKNLAKLKILETLENLKEGNFSEGELEIAKTSTKHSFNAIRDNKYTYISYIAGLDIYGADYTIEDIANKAESVTKEEVVNIAKGISLDTIYFLGEDKGNENERK